MGKGKWSYRCALCIGRQCSSGRTWSMCTGPPQASPVPAMSCTCWMGVLVSVPIPRPVFNSFCLLRQGPAMPPPKPIFGSGWRAVCFLGRWEGELFRLCLSCTELLGLLRLCPPPVVSSPVSAPKDPAGGGGVAKAWPFSLTGDPQDV